MKAKLIGLVVSVVVMGLASSAMAVSYASGVSQSGSIVSFILNQDAYSVQAILDGGATTLNLPTTKGSVSFDMGSATSYQIKVSSYAGSGWTQFIPNGADRNFYLPCGVSINKDPSSADFGKVYINVHVVRPVPVP